jgi:hypothetical protein
MDYIATTGHPPLPVSINSTDGINLQILQLLVCMLMFVASTMPTGNGSMNNRRLAALVFVAEQTNVLYPNAYYVDRLADQLGVYYEEILEQGWDPIDGFIRFNTQDFGGDAWILGDDNLHQDGYHFLAVFVLAFFCWGYYSAVQTFDQAARVALTIYYYDHHIIPSAQCLDRSVIALNVYFERLTNIWNPVHAWANWSSYAGFHRFNANDDSDTGTIDTADETVDENEDPNARQ